jgi:putative membrane protein insertion efficiency factor
MSIVNNLFISIIRFYQKFISPMTPPSCRYYPSCSQYAVEAIQTHGSLKGSYLAIKRLSRCHPFHQGGHDPVPENKLNNTHG